MSSLWAVETTTDFNVKGFLESPLVCWAKNLAGHDGASTSLSDLSNSEFLKDLLGEIDSQLLGSQVRWPDDPVLRRCAILENIIVYLRTYFLDVLGQVMVMRPPDILFISQFPGTEHAGQELKKLLLLLLCHAVQGRYREKIIERIQGFDEDLQKGIVECIKEVTDNPQRVWKIEVLAVSDGATADVDHGVLVTAQQHIKTLVEDREELIKLVLALWRENYQHKLGTSGEVVKKYPSTGGHHAAEMAGLKSQIRRLSQGIYEIEEELRETKDELTKSTSALQALQKENHHLTKEAALIKVYRDELDALYEKEKKTDRLESELSRCRSQLLEMEYYKNRIEEMQQNCLLLTETKILLESQLDAARKKLEVIPLLENELALVRADLNDAILECNIQREQARQLVVQKTTLALELHRLQADSGRVDFVSDLELRQENVPLSDQLNESLSAKVFRLEIENEKLRTIIEGKNTQHHYSKSSVESGDDSDNHERFSSISNGSTVDQAAQLEDCGYATTVTVSSMSEINYEPKQECEYESFILPVNGALLVPENPVRPSSGSDNFYEDQYADLKAEIVSLRKSVEHYRQFESKWNGSRAEDVRIRDELNHAQETIRNMENQVRGLESGVSELAKKDEELLAVRKDNESLLSSVKSLDQKLKVSERENKRLLSSLESQSASVIALQNRTVELEKVYTTSCSEVGRISELRSRLSDLEVVNGQLNQQLALSNDGLANLRNELVQEKVDNQTKQRWLTQIRLTLSNNGIFIPDAYSDQVENQVLDQIVTSAVNQITEKNHGDIMNELESLRSDYDTLRKIHEQEIRRARSAPSSISIESTCSSDLSALEQARLEALSVKQNLHDVKSEYRHTETRLAKINNAYEILQTAFKKLESVNAKLDMDVKSLRSSNASLSKNIEAHEKEKDTLLKNTEESQQMHSSIIADHEALQKFHEQLNSDYDKLMKELNRLRSDHRKATQELEVTRQKLRATEIESTRSRNNAEDVRMERLQKLETEHEKLVSENHALQNSNKHLSETYRVLTEEHKTVKTEVNQLKLQRIEYEGVVNNCQSQIQSKELESSRHTEILLGIIASLEEEKRSFASAIERLVLQYDDVFLHSWKEKNQMQSEHKELQDKLHALDLQKQLLIQKLYDTFKTNDVRKRNISFLKRVRRAAGELVGRSRSRSRTRALSPTDSNADSSSVESGNGGARPADSVASVHSLASYKIDQNDTRSGPQLSYSSDDLRKSSSASSCISPSEQLESKLKKNTSQESNDPAFHRVGSRRGIYQPPVVVHHPAITKQAQKVNQSSATRNSNVKIAQELESSKPGTKKCCSSYGGYHDCAMLSFTRLTATTSMSSSPSSPLRKDQDTFTRSGSRSNNCVIDGSTARVRQLALSPQTSLTENHLTPIAERKNSTSKTESSSKGYALKPKSSLSGMANGSSGDIVNAGESDSGSICSFPSSQSSLFIEPESVSSYSYYRSDHAGRSVSETPKGSLNGNAEEEPAVWYEYGCV